MKLEYTQPELTELGHVSDLTAATGTPVGVDVPYGTSVPKTTWGSTWPGGAG